MRSNGINGGVVDNAIYVDGVRTANPVTLDETYELLRERHGMAWIGLYRPTSGEIGSVAAEFGLHYLVVDDAIAAHQRPKLERYGAILFTVLRPARYDDRREQVEFGELHVVTGDGFVVTISTPRVPISRASGAVWNLSRISCGSDQKPSFTASWTRSSMSTHPLLQGWRTTSTKSRTSSSTTTPPSHAASMPSLVR